MPCLNTLYMYILNVLKLEFGIHQTIEHIRIKFQFHMFKQKRTCILSLKSGGMMLKNDGFK